MLEQCRYSRRAPAVSQYYKAAMALRIKELRIERQLTQQQLADAANMSRSQLAQIEAETRPGNTLRLNAIAAALKVDVDQLFAPENELEAELTKAFKSLNDSDKETILRLAKSLSSTQ